MMRAMLLEYPEDLNVRNLSTQYMLGGSLLVAPVFDQQKHHIYLPEGSWIDLETGARLNGSRWILYPRQIDVIPMFLRENTMMPTLKSAPDHVGEDNFRDLELVINITDAMEQAYYDDGVEGCFRAVLRGGVLDLTLRDVPAERFRIYSPGEISRVLVNGELRTVRREGSCFVV